MAKVIIGMTISLDGFVADQNGNAGRLYPDLAALRYTAYMKDAIEQTGAVLMGRRTFEMGDPDSYVGNYEFQVPIFVLTHHPPSVAPKQEFVEHEPPATAGERQPCRARQGQSPRPAISASSAGRHPRSTCCESGSCPPVRVTWW